MREVPITATQRRRIEAILMADHATVEDCAAAVLAEAWAMYDARSKYAVVARARDVSDGSFLAGVFPSFSTANGFGSTLAVSGQEAREFEWRVVPVAEEATPSAIRKALSTTAADRAKAAERRDAARKTVLARENARLAAEGQLRLTEWSEGE